MIRAYTCTHAHNSDMCTHTNTVILSRQQVMSASKRTNRQGTAAGVVGFFVSFRDNMWD